MSFKQFLMEETSKNLIRRLQDLKAEMAAAAQEVYDAWQPDEDGHGGICDEVAQAFDDVIVTRLSGVNVTEGGQDGDDHAWVVAYTKDEAVGIDIDPYVYERGGGYSWTKIPDVQIADTDVQLFPLDRAGMEDLDEDAGDDYHKAVAATARPWKKTTTYNYAVDKVIKSGDNVLDFGSGPFMHVKPRVEALGATYVPYDPPQGIGSDDLLKEKYDVVMASNVLNVSVKHANPESQYLSVMDQLTGLVDIGGTLVANMSLTPGSPKTDWMSPKRLESDLKERFQTVIRRGEVCEAKSPKI